MPANVPAPAPRGEREADRALRLAAYHMSKAKDDDDAASHARPFFHPHPFHVPVAAGIGALIGYSAWLSVCVLRARRGIPNVPTVIGDGDGGGIVAAVTAEIESIFGLSRFFSKTADDVYMPLQFDYKGRPNVFVNAAWGTLLYTGALGYSLAIYLVGDRGRYQVLEASLVYGAGAALVAACHHQAASIVLDGATYASLAEGRANGVDMGYGLDGGLLIGAAMAYGLATANVWLRARRERKRREQ